MKLLLDEKKRTFRVVVVTKFHQRQDDILQRLVHVVTYIEIVSKEANDVKKQIDNEVATA